LRTWCVDVLVSSLRVIAAYCLPMVAGGFANPNALATCPRCSALGWKMCFMALGYAAYARENAWCNVSGTQLSTLP
jgi:hypothetical protein